MPELKTEKTELILRRRDWPAAHDLLQRCSPGKYEARAAGMVMLLEIKPDLAAVLREALPAGAVVETRQGNRGENLHNLLRL